MNPDKSIEHFDPLRVPAQAADISPRRQRFHERTASLLQNTQPTAASDALFEHMKYRFFDNDNARMLGFGKMFPEATLVDRDEALYVWACGQSYAGDDYMHQVLLRLLQVQGGGEIHTKLPDSNGTGADYMLGNIPNGQDFIQRTLSRIPTLYPPGTVSDRVVFAREAKILEEQLQRETAAFDHGVVGFSRPQRSNVLELMIGVHRKGTLKAHGTQPHYQDVPNHLFEENVQ